MYRTIRVNKSRQIMEWSTYHGKQRSTTTSISTVSSSYMLHFVRCICVAIFSRYFTLFAHVANDVSTHLRRRRSYCGRIFFFLLLISTIYRTFFSLISCFLTSKQWIATLFSAFLGFYYDFFMNFSFFPSFLHEAMNCYTYFTFSRILLWFFYEFHFFPLFFHLISHI